MTIELAPMTDGRASDGLAEVFPDGEMVRPDGGIVRADGGCRQVRGGSARASIQHGRRDLGLSGRRGEPRGPDGGLGATHHQGVRADVGMAGQCHVGVLANGVSPILDGEMEPRRGLTSRQCVWQPGGRGEGARARTGPALPNGRSLAAHVGHPPADRGATTSFIEHDMPLARPGRRAVAERQDAV